MKPGDRMKQAIKSAMNGYKNPNQFAACKGYSYGLVYNGLKGVWSDTLAKQMGITKYPPRPGIFISCTEDIKAQFDAQRGDKSRTEHLIDLMDLDEGVGEVV